MFAHVRTRTYTSVSLRHPFLSAISLALSSADEEDRRCHVQVWECIRRERNKYKHSRFCAVRMHTYASIHVHVHTEHKDFCKKSVTGAGRVGCTALKPLCYHSHGFTAHPYAHGARARGGNSQIVKGYLDINIKSQTDSLEEVAKRNHANLSN